MGSVIWSHTCHNLALPTRRSNTNQETRKAKSKRVKFADDETHKNNVSLTPASKRRRNSNDLISESTSAEMPSAIREGTELEMQPVHQRRSSLRLMAQHRGGDAVTQSPARETSVTSSLEHAQKNAHKTPAKSSTHQKPIISSIFTKNPEIPKMKKTTAKEMKEEIFSSQNFADLNIHPYMVSNLRQSFNIEKVTSVQEKVIPLIREGRDVLVKSQTGSGKTLAYAIPIIQQLQAMEPRIKRDSGVFAIIVVPTRELAVQTFEWFHTLLKSFNRIVVACFMGGQKRKSEKASIRRGINVLVTTPQRFLDHLQNSTQLTIGKVKYLILDEADRLTDMGYERDIRSIVETLRRENEGGATMQVVMLSATLTAGVERLAGLSLNSPVVVDCAIETLATDLPNQLVTPSNLRQHFLVVPVKLRLVTLASFILWKCRGDQHKLLVFMPTQDMVDFHAKLFSHIVLDKEEVDPEQDTSNIDITQLHGNMSQQPGQQIIEELLSPAPLKAHRTPKNH